jgi:WD40 repeat protein
MSFLRIIILLTFTASCFQSFGQFVLSATLLGHTAPVNGLEVLSDGKKLLSCGKDNSIRLWDLSTNTQEKAMLELPSSIKKVVLSPDETHFYAGGYSFVLYCGLEKFKTEKTYKAHSSFVESIAVGKEFIATTSWRDKTTMLWNAKSFKKAVTINDSIWNDCSLFSKDGKILFTGDHTNLIKLWDVFSGELITKFSGHTDWVYDLALSPDNKFLYSAGFDGQIKVWDLQTQKNVLSFADSKGGLVAMDISKDGKYLAAGGMDKSILIYDLSSGKLFQKIDAAHEGTIMDLKFSSINNTIISAAIDGKIKIWKLNP